MLQRGVNSERQRVYTALANPLALGEAFRCKPRLQVIETAYFRHLGPGHHCPENPTTPADILEAIAGVFRADGEGREPYSVERGDGSWLLSGAMPADEMAERLGIVLPQDASYQTVAGFVLAQLLHLPITGESVEVMGWRFEVVDLDGRRIDKVLATRVWHGRRMLG